MTAKEDFSQQLCKREERKLYHTERKAGGKPILVAAQRATCSSQQRPRAVEKNPNKSALSDDLFNCKNVVPQKCQTFFSFCTLSRQMASSSICNRFYHSRQLLGEKKSTKLSSSSSSRLQGDLVSCTVRSFVKAKKVLSFPPLSLSVSSCKFVSLFFFLLLVASNETRS